MTNNPLFPEPPVPGYLVVNVIHDSYDLEIDRRCDGTSLQPTRIWGLSTAQAKHQLSRALGNSILMISEPEFVGKIPLNVDFQFPLMWREYEHQKTKP